MGCRSCTISRIFEQKEIISLEDLGIQTVEQAYVNMDKDKDAKDFLTTVGMLD